MLLAKLVVPKATELTSVVVLRVILLLVAAVLLVTNLASLVVPKVMASVVAL